MSLETVEVSHRTEENDDTSDNHAYADNLVNQLDAVIIELASNLIDEPGESEPPDECSEDNAQKPDTHFK